MKCIGWHFLLSVCSSGQTLVSSWLEYFSLQKRGVTLRVNCICSPSQLRSPGGRTSRFTDPKITKQMSKRNKPWHDIQNNGSRRSGHERTRSFSLSAPSVLHFNLYLNPAIFSSAFRSLITSSRIFGSFSQSRYPWWGYPLIAEIGFNNVRPSLW